MLGYVQTVPAVNTDKHMMAQMKEQNPTLPSHSNQPTNRILRLSKGDSLDREARLKDFSFEYVM